jgi:UDP-N-acetylglucosamine--N-acetylmuramyl-(pentapeptide) pyrophosphoryl-undecaprenol N-acetylglucosamine transferase
MAFRVLLTGGGTGGHVYPLMAVADALKKKSSELGIDLELLVVGEGQFFKEACLAGELNCKNIVAGKIRRYFSFLNFVDIFKMPVGFIQSLWYLFWFMPDVVLAKGGYASFMPALVAKLYFIPLLIHESDSVSGLTNKFLGKLADVVFTSFKSAESNFKAEKVRLVGNPIRPELTFGDHGSALNYFNFSSDKKTLLFLGGSQGAKVINDAVLNSVVQIAKEFQIIHQCGQNLFNSVSKEIEKISKEGAGEYADNLKNNYKLYPFFGPDELRMAYAAADVIISRAGAANIFEISAVGKPAIIVPITKSASNHQFLNAQEFSRFGAVLIEEQNLTTNIILNQVKNILKPENYSTISEKIKLFANNDSANLIAEQLLAYRK